MATTCKRRTVRETSEIDQRTRRPLIIKINEGGKTVSIKVKGCRTWYTVTVRQIWVQGAYNEAAHIRAEKKAKRDQRKQELRERNRPA